MSAIRVRGFALPHGEPVDLFADGDRWTTDPVPGAEVVAEGWLVPGLVDAHTHPGAAAPGDPLDHDLLREHLHQHVDAGVTAIRSPGLADDPPAWFGTDPDVPRAWHAGPWLAQQDQFFEGWGRRPSHADLPAVAAADALAAASWSAREYLGLPGLVPGAPADAVVYEEDPRTDLDQLAAPAAVILRGRRVR